MKDLVQRLEAHAQANADLTLNDTARLLREAAAALRAHLPAPDGEAVAVPDGFVLVPRQLIGDAIDRINCSIPGWEAHVSALDDAFHAAHPAPAPSVPAGWVRQKPTEPGAYWLKGNMLDKPELVSLIRVERVDGELCVYSSEDPFGTAALLSRWSNDFWWLGPLLPAAPTAASNEGEEA